MERRNYTIVQHRPSEFSSIDRPKKRLMTEFVQNEAAYFAQRYIDAKKHKTSKFTRCSGQDQKHQEQNKAKKFTNFEEILQLLKKNGKGSSKKDQPVKDEKSSEIDILKAHIDTIPVRKPRKMHHRTQTQPNLYYGDSKKTRNRTAEVPMDRINYSKCCGLVDDIYGKIAILKEIGYSDDKIDSWVLAFCEGRKPFMKTIFMRNINYSVYSLKEEFQYEKDIKSVKERIRFQIQKNKDVFNYVEVGQLSELSYYLQQILIQKNMKKAKEVQQSILEKLSFDLIPKMKNDFCVFTKKEPIEVYNFLEELGPFQNKFGDFGSLSKINKLRLLQLNKVEKNLKTLYKQILENEHKKVERLRCRQKTLKISIDGR